MDNNSNFEQQFTQNVKAAAVQPAYEASVSNASSGSGKLPLIIAIALAAIVLVESIALVITLSNAFSSTGEEENEDEIIGDEIPNNNYIYENDSLVAFNSTCTAEDGTYYAFDTDKNYEQHDSTGAIINSGTYTITNDSLVSIKGSNKVLYYDGFDIADGLTIYTCEDIVMETNSNDESTD